jgi:Asp-tRNA(Asn)/Glu-tRNA(Gln) amidotransferase A subunit family amidase
MAAHAAGEVWIVISQADYLTRDAMALAELIESGGASAVEVVEAAIARAEAVNPKINAIVTPTYPLARETARSSIRGHLAGVPFLIKDLNYVAGVRCSNGSRLWADFVPDHDGEIVTRYRNAGLVLLGKSNTPEVGLAATTESVLLGACRNPWNPARTAGGSSGGAAAAVAAGIVPAAHATDGGGSIRIPASCCGLVGLKPTRARTPLGPDVGEGWGGMSIGHVVSRTVRDSAILLDLTHGPARGDPYHAPAFTGAYLDCVTQDPKPLRVAIDLVPVSGGAVHPECREAVRRTAVLLESLGHRVEEKSPDFDRSAFTGATDTVVLANVANNIHARARALGTEPNEDNVERNTLRLATWGRTVTADRYAAAIQHIHAIGRKLEAFLTAYDLVLSPTLLQPPVPLGYLDTNSTDTETYVKRFRSFWGFTSLYNATGQPAISLPLHKSADGLPVGVQLAAPFGDEARLFRVAGQIERAVGGFSAMPVL